MTKVFIKKEDISLLENLNVIFRILDSDEDPYYVEIELPNFVEKSGFSGHRVTVYEDDIMIRQNGFDPKFITVPGSGKGDWILTYTLKKGMLI